MVRLEPRDAPPRGPGPHGDGPLGGLPPPVPDRRSPWTKGHDLPGQGPLDPLGERTPPGALPAPVGRDPSPPAGGGASPPRTRPGSGTPGRPLLEEKGEGREGGSPGPGPQALGFPGQGGSGLLRRGRGHRQGGRTSGPPGLAALHEPPGRLILRRRRALALARSLPRTRAGGKGRPGSSARRTTPFVSTPSPFSGSPHSPGGPGTRGPFPSRR